MEWPPASNPASLTEAVKAFFGSSEQSPDSEPLEGLLVRLEEVRKGDQSELWDKIIELLADASRDQKWREPIEKSGLLKYYLEKLDSATLPAASSKQLLRAVGNGVADRDESRAVVLPSLDKVISCIQSAALTPFAVSVLYNTCLGYELAQKEAAGLRLDRQLCCLLSHDNLNSTQVIELLAWVSDKLSEDVLSDSEDCLNAIMQAFPACDEWDNFRHLIAAASVYLQDSTIQTKILHSDGFPQIMRMLKQKTDQLSLLQQTMDEDEKKDFLEDLQIASGLVMNIIARITASDDFTRLYTLDSPLIKEQGEWLQLPSPILRTCACITLGNIAVSDEINITMVHDLHYHIPTIAILQTATERSLVYLAAGFLRHLAQPKENVVTVAAAGAIPATTALLGRKSTELDFEAAAILRRLVNHSYDNAATLAADTSTLAQLHTAAKQTKTGFEVGRLLIAVCRKLREHEATTGGAEDTLPLWSSLLAHEEATRPLLLMVRQEQVPALASEAWFGFGLMAGTKEGARKVADAFKEDEDWKVIRDAVVAGEQDSPNRKNAQTAVHLTAQMVDDGEVKARFEELARESREAVTVVS